MVKILSRDGLQRMVGGRPAANAAGTGGGDVDLGGYVRMDYMKSLTWWGQGIPDDSTAIVGAMTGVTDITMTGGITGATAMTMANGPITGVTTLTASGLVTVGSLQIGDAVLEWDSQSQSLKLHKSTGANDAVSMYATGSVSALGYGSGGSGSATALTDLVDVNIASPTNGQALVYDSTSSKWTNATIQGGGGISMSDVWTGLAGNTSEQINASHLTTALTGYATQSYATQVAQNALADAKTWVGQQGYLTSSAISDMATQTWVGQQGYLTSSAISDMATQTWVGQQGFLTSVAFSDLSSHPTTLGGYGITDCSIVGNDITIGLDTLSLDDYVPVTGYPYLSGTFEPETNYGANLGRSNYRFDYIYGRYGDFSGSLVIGGCRLVWDSANNALKVEKADGTAANFYATGGVSALGYSS